MSERDDVSEADLSEPFTNEDAAKLGRFVADFGAWQAVFNRLAIATPAELESRLAAAEAALAACEADTARLDWAWRNGFFSGGEGRPSFLPRKTLDELREAIDAERAPLP